MARRGSAGIGYGQAFLLVFCFLVASVIIFLFGMWVGRDLGERRLAEEPGSIKMAVPSRPTPGGPTEGVGRDFYDGLKTKAYQQLQTPTPVPSVALPSPTMPPNTPTQPIPTPTPRLVLPTATLPPVERPTATVRSIPPAPPRPAPPAQGEASQGQLWTVQVGATMDAREALDMTLRLRGLGFAAFTVQAPLRGQTWYRVRVGRFASREEARAVEVRLRQTGEFQGAYVTTQ